MVCFRKVWVLLLKGDIIKSKENILLRVLRRITVEKRKTMCFSYSESLFLRAVIFLLFLSFPYFPRKFLYCDNWFYFCLISLIFSYFFEVISWVLGICKFVRNILLELYEKYKGKIKKRKEKWNRHMPLLSSRWLHHWLYGLVSKKFEQQSATLYTTRDAINLFVLLKHI